MARKVGRRLGRYDDDDDEGPYKTEWEQDARDEAEDVMRPAGRRAQWRQTEGRLSQRAAKCPRVYEKATALQKKSRNGSAPSCNDAAIGKAVLQAFAGPCKKAEKAYRKAAISCKRIGR
jgi:hypothetical protein